MDGNGTLSVSTCAKFGFGVQNEAGQSLTEFCKRMHQSQKTPSSNNIRDNFTHGHYQMVNTEIRLIILFVAKDGEKESAKNKKRLNTWTLPDGQYRNQIDYILCSKDGEAKTRLGADCGSDHELLIAKFRLKLKKLGKTTRPFRYDPNQIPYDYTAEVKNRFKGLDLIDRVPDELWTEVRDIVQETGIKTIPMEKKCKKAKWLSGEALQIALKRREAKSKGEKEKRKDISI